MPYWKYKRDILGTSKRRLWVSNPQKNLRLSERIPRRVGEPLPSWTHIPLLPPHSQEWGSHKQSSGWKAGWRVGWGAMCWDGLHSSKAWQTAGSLHLISFPEKNQGLMESGLSSRASREPTPGPMACAYEQEERGPLHSH